MPTFFDSMSCPLSFSTISSHYLEIVHTINQLPIGPSNVHPMVTQIKDGIIKPKQFPFSTLVILPKSTCFAQAKDILEWEMATKVKLDAFIHNNTWTLVPKSKNCKPIASKWLYKVNLKSDCTLDIYKCRVVAKGYKQKLCIDNYETFSLVVKP